MYRYWRMWTRLFQKIVYCLIKERYAKINVPFTFRFSWEIKVTNVFHLETRLKRLFRDNIIK